MCFMYAMQTISTYTYIYKYVCSYTCLYVFVSINEQTSMVTRSHLYFGSLAMKTVSSTCFHLSNPVLTTHLLPDI